MDPTGTIALREVSKVFVPLRGKLPWPRVLGGGRGLHNSGLKALDAVSFQVRTGEVVGLIGSNGSGKSTLLQIIAGTLKATSGSVEASGRVSALLELGSGFNPDFTGLENIFLTASVLGLDREETESRLKKIVEFSGVEDFLDYPVRTYSSGMALRLAFAIQTQVDPDILIVDEALAVGDIFFQQKCFRYLQEDLEGVTRVLVTHDLDALSKVAPRTIVLDRGQLVFDGDSREAIELYVKLAQEKAYGRGEASTVSVTGGDMPADDIALPWITPADEQLSGRRDIRIERAALISADGAEAKTLRSGQPYMLHFQLKVGKAPVDLVLGYIVHDRQGQNVCGGTSAESQDGPVHIPEKGQWDIELVIDWPALRVDEYTITVGVGEGASVQNQVVQCWANHLFHVGSSLNGRPGDQLLTLNARQVHVRRV